MTLHEDINCEMKTFLFQIIIVHNVIVLFSITLVRYKLVDFLSTEYVFKHSSLSIKICISLADTQLCEEHSALCGHSNLYLSHIKHELENSLRDKWLQKG